MLFKKHFFAEYSPKWWKFDGDFPLMFSLETNVGHASGLGTRPGAKAALPGLGNVRLPEEF